ncbi:HAD-IIA family hydrolase [Methylicorpusculum sp.]|uniref:HAD-IIA family hydrolase n=1 Tax=Methylicorpusculum sp. TaxID=2713644 RepID=UPI00272F3A9E|nr:HAD-IIA family hydrolase [Methylicorpusculum sp.]MDP2178234.1 HAD-IIA family hydrolase [Methylicorpusculum sp.]MDP3530549.1 HAD-IIA family hydrolase [Methylicorpusculum sp.]MDZ4151585.1 HAD-IIA family hydrolase [Methylicorpusculum sp.]
MTYAPADFSKIRSLIIDMDGVLWQGDAPFPGLIDFFSTLRNKGISFVLATNNASHTPEQYVIKLERMGVKVTINEILTSAMATASYLAERYTPTETRVFVIGEDGAVKSLADQGFILTDVCQFTDTEEAKSLLNVDIVVSGKDRSLTWDKLATATINIRAGAAFYGTNGDTTLPTEFGLIHGNGAILAALETATGKAPIIIGKPEPTIYQQAMAILGALPGETIAIGDRLETDILGAVRTGIQSIMVLSGVSTLEDLKSSDYQPSWVMNDIRAITDALNASL